MPQPVCKLLHDKAVNSLKFHFNVAIESHYLREKRTNLVMPELCFNQRGKVAGSAHLKNNLIKLNRKLYEHNQEYFFRQVIPHELSHLIVAQVYRFRVKPHGIEWREIMVNVFNLPTDVTHKLDTSVLGFKTFSYFCNCQTIELSRIRHNKVVNKKQMYKCRKCGFVLKPVESVCK